MLLLNCIITAFCSIILIEITTAESKFQMFTKSNESGIRLEPMKPRLNGYSIIMCGDECEKTENCVSFSYHATMELCEINRYNPDDELATTYESTGWEIYIKYEEKCWPADGYEGFVKEGSCYFWDSERPGRPWANATADCQANGADLVCINSEAENQLLIDHVPMAAWWFGLNDLDGDRVTTCKGNKPSFTKYKKELSWRNKCGFVEKSSTLWLPDLCDHRYPYACEK